MQGFGEKLRALRLKTGKSQSEVAQEIRSRPDGKLLKLSQATYSVLENLALAPKEKTLKVLAAYFKVPVTYFYDPPAQDASYQQAYDYLQRLADPSYKRLVYPADWQEADCFDT